MLSQDEITEYIIPELDQNLEIYPFNDLEYVIQHSILDYQININKQTHELINLIDGKRNINEIKNIYEKENNIKLSNEFIRKLLYERLAKYGIIKQDEYQVEKRKRASYLRLSFIFIKAKFVGYIYTIPDIPFPEKGFLLLNYLHDFFYWNYD